MGKVRMADIAAKVGVSTVTVHNALTGNKGVSDEMREKIQKVADELGYRCHYFREIFGGIYYFLLENVSGACFGCC